MDDLVKTMNSQLSGVQPSAAPNTPSFAMNITIKGNDAATTFNVACSGIDGCVGKLQQASTALVREQKRIDTFKADYIGKSFRATEQFTQQLRQALSPQSEALRNQLKSMNAALATLGVEDMVEIDDVRGADLEQDEREEFAGLPKVPESILDLIGSKMTPPLLNVAGDNYSKALAGISQASNALKDKESKLAQLKTRLGPLAEKCRSEDLEERVEAIKSQAQTYAGCAKYYCYRSQMKEGDFVSLAQSIQNLMLPGAPVAALSSVKGYLENGQNSCKDENEDWKIKYRAATREKETACNRAESAFCQTASNDPSKDPSNSCDTYRSSCSKATDDVVALEQSPRNTTGENCDAVASDIRDKVDRLGNRQRALAAESGLAN
jgi:hypothetical protein